ncbi:hypothetical protein [Calidithermus timidus]|jgi:hypothetical protein|uniref:hypothetical protein n=1 Tax=Calidithermus timidus TaxID=307124 RepID=UPI00037DB153|nr:hypothetical protein [Calidithermus timidus]
MNAKKLLIGAALLSLGLSLAQTPQQPAQPNRPAPGLSRMMDMRGGSLLRTAAQFLGVMPHELALLSNGQKTIADVARDLGADVTRLEAALTQARNQAIDQAVQNQVLTTEQAATYKKATPAVVKAFLAQKLDASSFGSGRGGFGDWGRGFGPGGRR